MSFVFFLPPFVSFRAQFQLARGHGVFRALLHIDFVYIGSNVSMDTMTDSWDPSGALSDAPCDDVSRLLLGTGHFLQTV